ncbi:MAG: aldehyde ferredoxin oxidoreductase N-terminal domain-containing protein [Desulfobacteraceae bacterium]|jgi:aldehyde:ferredoxin oxidoreductase
MRYAETGFQLEVDLSKGSIDKVETDPKDTALYLGGNGMDAKLLFDRVPPGADPWSPDNLLIFGNGLLNGTCVPGANRVSVDTIAPLNGLMGHSLMGGFFGPEMKMAGYDRIVIRGEAPDLVYLSIHNDKVEIRDARHLRGKGMADTQRLIQEELNDKRAWVASIGPAGEHRVIMASIDCGNSSAARTVGPVMGAKKLKAIAIRGTKDVYLAHPAEAWEMCSRLRKELDANPNVGDWMATDEDDSFHHNNFSWGNARVRRKKFWSKELEERWRNLKYDHMDRWTGCWNCPKSCHNLIKWPNRRRFSYKCYGKDTYHMAAFQELDFTFEILPIAQDLGLDSYSTPQVIAFALELLEAGILTEKDFPDMPSDIRQRFYYLLQKIAFRDGIGDVLAEGVSGAAAIIGNGAEEFDHNTVKKFEQLPIKLGKLNPAYFLMIGTGEDMAITQIEGSFPQDPITDPELKEEFIRNWVAVPDKKFHEWFRQWEKRDQLPDQAMVEICDWNECMHYLDDSLGLCGFVSSFRGQFGGTTGYHVWNMPQIITYTTGMEFDKDRLWECFQRNRNLVRALNNRLGLRRFMERPPEDHWAVRNEEYEQLLLTKYYDFKGWTFDGIPTKETLEKLSLGYVAEDLIERGILTGNEVTALKDAKAKKEKE